MRQRLLCCFICLICSTPAPAQSVDLSVQNVRKALAAQRAAAAAHPRDPALQVELAYTLSDAGMNDLAIQTVAKATAAAPNSSFAYSAQAWVLRHNLVGVDFGRGYDYDAALVSYRKAIDLDPKDLDIRQSLANLYEHDRNGVEHGSSANLDAAIDIYRYVQAHQVAVKPEVVENLAIALFYAGHYQEALAEVAGQPHTPKIDGVAIGAMAALKGSAAAVDFANQLPEDQKKKDALDMAAEGLWNMRLYAQAADVLTASLPNADSTGDAAKIQLFRHLKPYQRDEFPESDPRRPVQRVLAAEILDSLTQKLLEECVSRYTLPQGQNWSDALAQTGTIAAHFRALERKTGLPRAVVEDLLLGNMKIRTVESGSPGARIVVEFPGEAAVNFFVVKEPDGWRAVGDDRESTPIGMEALYLLHNGREPEARALLDWKRDGMHRDQGDDPLGGALLAGLWTSGESAGAEAIERAAASLVEDNATLLTLLPAIQASAKSASTDAVRDADDLLLAQVYLRTKDAANAQAVTRRLLSRYGSSATAVRLAGEGFRLGGQFAAWKALVEAQVTRHPADRELLLEAEKEAEAEHDFVRALALARKILDGGHAVAEDYSNYARLGLFADHVDEQSQQAAQQANLLGHSNNASYMLTAAWVNAALGQTAEAREMLLDAMDAVGMDEPDADVWFGFGRIFEQYGVDEAAAAAYRRVTRKKATVDEMDSFALAQARLKALRLK